MLQNLSGSRFGKAREEDTRTLRAGDRILSAERCRRTFARENDSAEQTAAGRQCNGPHDLSLLSCVCSISSNSIANFFWIAMTASA